VELLSGPGVAEVGVECGSNNSVHFDRVIVIMPLPVGKGAVSLSFAFVRLSVRLSVRSSRT